MPKYTLRAFHNNKDNKATMKVKAIILTITAILIASPIKAQNATPHRDGIDNYLQYAPIVTTYALKAAGAESASSWKRMTVNTAISFGLSCGTAYVLKHTVHDRRPDGSDNRAFPSGHTVIAFAGAVALDKEFRHLSPWISVVGYAVATATAIDRVRRDRHNWDDIAAGAAIGIAGTELGYWLGDKITGEKSRWSITTDGQTLGLVVKL